MEPRASQSNSDSPLLPNSYLMLVVERGKLQTKVEKKSYVVRAYAKKKTNEKKNNTRMKMNRRPLCQITVEAIPVSSRTSLIRGE